MNSMYVGLQHAMGCSIETYNETHGNTCAEPDPGTTGWLLLSTWSLRSQTVLSSSSFVPRRGGVVRSSTVFDTVGRWMVDAADGFHMLCISIRRKMVLGWPVKGVFLFFLVGYRILTQERAWRWRQYLGNDQTIPNLCIYIYQA